MDLSGIGKKSGDKLKNPATSGDVSGSLDFKPAEAPAESEGVSADLSSWLTANTEPKLQGVGIRQDTPSPEATAEEKGRISEVAELPTRGNKGAKRAARTRGFVPEALRPAPEDATDLTTLMRKQDANDTLNKMKAAAATGGDLSKIDKAPLYSVLHAGTQVTDDYSHFAKMDALVDHMDNHLDTTGLKLPLAGRNVGALRDLITAARNHVTQARELHAQGKLHPTAIGTSSSRSTGTGRGKRPEELLNMNSAEMDPTESRALKHIMTNFPLEQRGAGAEDDMRAGIGAGGIFDNLPEGSAAHLFRAGQYVSQVASLLHQATKNIQEDEGAKSYLKSKGQEVPGVWNGHIKVIGDVKEVTDSYGASVNDPKIMDRIAAGAQRAEATPEQVASVFQPQRDRVKNLQEATAHHADIARQIATQAYHATFGAQLAARQTSYANRTAAYNEGADARSVVTDTSGNKTDFSGVLAESERHQADAAEASANLRNLVESKDRGTLRDQARYTLSGDKLAARMKELDEQQDNESARFAVSSARAKDVVPGIMAALKGHPQEQQFQALADLHSKAQEDLLTHVTTLLPKIPLPVNPFNSGKFSESGIRKTIMSSPEYTAADAAKDEGTKQRIIAQKTREIKNSDEYIAQNSAYKGALVKHSRDSDNAVAAYETTRKALGNRVKETYGQFLRVTGYSDAASQRSSGAPTINMRGIPSLEDYISASNIPTNLVQQRREDGSYYLGSEQYQGEGLMGGWKPATAEEAMKYVRNKYVSPGSTVEGSLPAMTNYISFPNMSKRNPVRFPYAREERTGLSTPLTARRDNITNLESATKEDGTPDTVARRQGGRLREALAGYYSGDPTRLVTKSAFQSQSTSENLLRREQEWNAQGDSLERDAREERVARSGDRLIGGAKHDLELLEPMIDKAERHMINLKSRSYARPERQAQHEEEIAAHGEVLKKHYQHRDMLTALARTAQSDYIPMASGSVSYDEKGNQSFSTAPYGGAVSIDRITGARTGDYGRATAGVNTVYGNPDITYTPATKGGEKQWWEDEEDTSPETAAEKLELSGEGMIKEGTRKLGKKGKKDDSGIPRGYQIEDGDISGKVGEPELDESDTPDETPNAENVKAVAEAKNRVTGLVNPRKRK
jgi:hypothetical protein